MREDDILAVNDYDTPSSNVYVVLNGKVMMKQHSLD